MASGRMLNRSISKSHDVAALMERVREAMGEQHAAQAALLFTWCIPFQDVEGRMHGDARLVRADVIPLLEYITVADVAAYLGHMAAVGLVQWYEAKGRRWLAFPGFKAAQPGIRKEREAPSNIPAPDDGPPVGGGSYSGNPRSNSGVTPGEVKRREEKRREEKLPQLFEESQETREPDPTTAIVRSLFDALNSARKESVDGARTLSPLEVNLAGIRDRLKEGASPEDIRHVIAVYAAESKVNPKAQLYFDAESPFRPKNFQRALSKTVRAVLAPTPDRNGRPEASGRQPSADEVEAEDERKREKQRADLRERFAREDAEAEALSRSRPPTRSEPFTRG